MTCEMNRINLSIYIASGLLWLSVAYAYLGRGELAAVQQLMAEIRGSAGVGLGGIAYMAWGMIALGALCVARPFLPLWASVLFGLLAFAWGMFAINILAISSSLQLTAPSTLLIQAGASVATFVAVALDWTLWYRRRSR